jgi:hypothetical protein
MWLDLLKKEVVGKGLKQVAKELGISKSTVSLVVKGKYQANTKNIQDRITAIFGNDGEINCPVLERISPNRCAETREKAKRIGSMVSNPETLRLYKTCIKCTIRR